jgi:hemoglobin
MQNSADLPVISLYSRIGGEAGIKTLVDRFYDLMDSLPEVRELRDMHGANLDPIRQVLFEFLSGWLGGPQLFLERRGEPRLRMRHLPFKIGRKERDQWIFCMFKAMQDVSVPDALQEELKVVFWTTADHMRNLQDEHSANDLVDVVVHHR